MNFKSYLKKINQYLLGNEGLDQRLDEYSNHKISELIGLRAIPLTTGMMDRLGYSVDNRSVYHLTNIKHLEELVKIQNTKKQISTFSKGGAELARLPSQPNILVRLLGTEIISGSSDIWTLPDTNGRRWIDQTDRVENNKLTFMINGMIQKIFSLYNVLENSEDVTKMSPKELQNFIDNLSNQTKSKIYAEYIDRMERYIDQGGYKELQHYLKNASNLSYNEVILSNFKIIDVRALDIESPLIVSKCAELSLVYSGVFSSRELKNLKI